ncbi:uncharacterized protein [Cicer arietinum]|uniref:Uncharacterized protein LOC101497805 isoform X2 n=1 Tax=Cicer arietinum TaxID=3827 RepID=A0A1S2YUS9_CICAR|nr:uncharacterized protein LOC101497805 isoform X2 [Cicer arietinum]
MSLLGKRGRELKLLMSCPSLSNSKIIQFITYDDKKIDLGSIARNFGLDPSTLRLNGYFISRGVDLISSSVTWNSLLSFFSSKGLSTGKDYHDALLVTAKVGNKRGHESQDFQNGICKVIESEYAGSCRGNELDDINLLKNKKLRESKSGEILNGLNCKRKQQFEDVNQFKKSKINEDKSGISHSQFTCSVTSKNLKRFREDDTIVAANYKRIR